MIINSISTWKKWALTFPAHANADAPYRSPFTVLNKGSDKEDAEILIYDVIGRDFWSGEGMAAKDFSELLKGINSKAKLIVGINSPGGNVDDGLAIFNALQRRGNVVTRNDGMAASIASVILQAGTERQSAESAMVMIHRAWALFMGNANDMEKFKAVLEKHDQVIAETYASRSGKPVAEFIAAMDKETFFTGNESKDAGLVDTVLRSNTSPNASLAHKPHGAAAVAPVISAALVGVADGVITTPPVNQNQRHTNMSTPANAPAETVTPAAPIDLTPVIAAINSLGEKITAAQTPPGSAPVAPVIQNLGNPAIEKMRAMEHGKGKSDFIRNNYVTLHREMGGVKNANTVDANLANSLVASDAVQTMRTLMAPMAAFTRSVSINPISPRQVINVPLVSSAGSMQTNPTNFETGDTVAADIAVTVNQYSKSFHVSHPEGNIGGINLAALVPTNAMVLAEGVFGLVTTLMSNANYGGDVNIGAAADFSSTDLPAILALGKNYNRCTLIIDGGHLAYLLPTTRESFVYGEAGAYGFDGGIYRNNYWTGGAADLAGFVCGPDAIVIASGAPAQLPSGEFLSQESVSIGGGLSVTASTWFSRGSRAMWGSLDVMFGCAAGDKTQGEVLTTQ